MDSEKSEELDVKVWMHQGSVLPHFYFAVMADIANDMAKKDVKSELLYADDQTSEINKGLGNKF